MQSVALFAIELSNPISGVAYLNSLSYDSLSVDKLNLVALIRVCNHPILPEKPSTIVPEQFTTDTLCLMDCFIDTPSLDDLSTCDTARLAAISALVGAKLSESKLTHALFPYNKSKFRPEVATLYLSDFARNRISMDALSPIRFFRNAVALLLKLTTCEDSTSSAITVADLLDSHTSTALPLLKRFPAIFHASKLALIGVAVRFTQMALFEVAARCADPLELLDSNLSELAKTLRMGAKGVLLCQIAMLREKITYYDDTNGGDDDETLEDRITALEAAIS